MHGQIPPISRIGLGCSISEFLKIAEQINQRSLAVLRTLRPTSLPTAHSRIPNARQMVGTNRLWGGMLGLAFGYDQNDAQSAEDFIDIAALSRAILVLDDFLDDEYVMEDTRKLATNWSNSIETYLFDIFDRVGLEQQQFVSLRNRAAQEMSNRRVANYTYSMFQSSIEKCLIFFNPYRLESDLIHHSVLTARLNFLAHFFFACQLLDDFQDLDEDRSKKTNHNVFLCGKSYDEMMKVCDQRMRWLPFLISALRHNLLRKEVISGTDESPIMLQYHENATYFLDKVFVTNTDIVDEHSTALNFETMFGEGGIDITKYSSKFSICESWKPYIRPEFLQTFKFGFRSIDQV